MSSSGLLLGVGENVSHTPNGTNQLGAVPHVHFVSNVLDIDVHEIGVCVVRSLPNVFHDHGPADRLPGVHHQVFEKRELFRGQVDLSPGPLDPKFRPIENEIPNPGDARWNLPVAPEEGTNPGS
jgi:hypothetical protein